MSANEDAIRAWYATLDFETHLAEDVDFEVMEGFLEGGKYNGRQEVVAMFARYMKNFTEFKAEVTDVIDGDRAVTGIGVYRGILASNGQSFGIPFCHIWYMQDHKIVRMRHFVNTLLMHYAINKELIR